MGKAEIEEMPVLAPRTPIPAIKRRRLIVTKDSHSSPSPSSDAFSIDAKLWKPLNLPHSELSLPLTFPTGQTFRWKQTAPQRFTGSVGPHLFSLEQTPNGVSYCLHTTTSEAAAESSLLDFLNASISLAHLWENFSRSDPKFSQLACHLAGARVLRQDPFDCLFQFLCSSNNNIGRITKMVDYFSSLGEPIGEVSGVMFHQFPSLHRLSCVSEKQLRDAGFGYRAKYITSAVRMLKSKPSGWLESLREVELREAIDGLRSLPGVGPKVAACVALFSLDQHHAIPVDTHVWQVAQRHLLPEFAGVRLTPKLHDKVADAFVDKFGRYAGWAQTLLFIAELPAQRALLPRYLWTSNL